MIFFKQTNKKNEKQEKQEIIIIIYNLLYYYIDCIFCIYLFIKYVFRKHAKIWKHQ